MRLTVVLAAVVFLAGCATIEPVGRQAPAFEEVNDTNYELGRPQTTVVGDTLVRVRKYVLERREVSAVKANMDFAVLGGGYNIHFARDQVTPISGKRVEDGITYYVVPIIAMQLGLAPASLSLQVREDGVLHSKAIGGGVIYSYRPSPPEGRLLPVIHTDVVKDRPFVNYEIIFNGSDGQAMRFTYREYSADDMARTAFYQELSYPVSAKTIRFRNLLLDVVELTDQAVTVIVRED